MHSFEKLAEMDIALANLRKEANLWQYFRPINAQQEKITFLQRYYEEGVLHSPLFDYRHVPKLAPYSHQVKQILKKLNCINSPLSYVYHEILLSMKKMIRLLSHNRDTDVFRRLLSEIYGIPDNDILQLSDSILRDSSTDDQADGDQLKLTAEDIAGQLSSTLKEMGFQWQVEISEEISSRVSLDSLYKCIRIKQDASITPQDLQRFKIHEIETHVFRYENGTGQPLKVFAHGFDNYMATEEGIAVLREKAATIDYEKTLRLYAARAKAASLTVSVGFCDVFTSLLDYFDADMAFDIAQRVKRGLCDTNALGGMTRDHVYLTGYRQVCEYIESGGYLSTLYAGKIRVSDAPLVEELISRGELTAPRYLPEDPYITVND